jgi:hypothetical protein
MANRKYVQLKDQGLWCAPMKEQQDIIALEAKWEKKYQAQVKASKPAKKAGDDKKDKEKSNKKLDWMLKETTGSEPKTKTMNKKEYQWCPNQKCWTRHKPSECNGRNTNSNTTPLANHLQENTPGLQITSAYHAIADADE